MLESLLLIYHRFQGGVDILSSQNCCKREGLPSTFMASFGKTVATVAWDPASGSGFGHNLGSHMSYTLFAVCVIQCRGEGSF